MKRFKYLLAILPVLLLHGCFDVSENIYTELDKNNFYKDEKSVMSSVAGLYSRPWHIPDGSNSMMEASWMLEEFSADQISWRVWNGDYGLDGREKLVITNHIWTTTSRLVEKLWETNWEAIGRATNTIADLQGLSPSSVGMTADGLESYIAEARTLRAWSYYVAFQTWGGAIPLVKERSTEPVGSAHTDFDEGSKLIWQFLVDELDATVSKLPKNQVNRMNQAANRVMKARLLFNSELFTGTARYDECAALCEEIMSGEFGTYTLATDHTKIYAHDNHTCEEVIFAFANSPTQLNNSTIRGSIFYPYNANLYFDYEFPAAPWNCAILTPSFDNSAEILKGGQPKSFLTDYGDKLGAPYERFHDNDIRKQNFVCDNQGNYSGMFLKGLIKEDFGTGDPLKADTDRNNQDLVLVDQVGVFQKPAQLKDVMSPMWGETNSGIRLVKQPIYPDASGFDYREPDDVDIRLTEVVYMLAECQLRGATTTKDAKTLVNEVRQRYFSDTDWVAAQNEPGPGFTAFDLDWMLNEWGKEFLGEGRRRRTDLRRHDQFTKGQWWFFGRAANDDGEGTFPAVRDEKYEWFPLPESAKIANPKLSQNPKY